MVPGETVIEMLKKGMKDRGWNKKVFILDGYPRNQSNIEFWKDIMKNDVEEMGAIYLNVSVENMNLFADLDAGIWIPPIKTS